MVILVGNAARFVIRTMAIASIAVINKIKLFPACTTANTVNGVSTQPWPARAIANQEKRFSCWFSHQFINPESINGFDSLAL